MRVKSLAPIGYFILEMASSKAINQRSLIIMRHICIYHFVISIWSGIKYFILYRSQPEICKPANDQVASEASLALKGIEKCGKAEQ